MIDFQRNLFRLKTYGHISIDINILESTNKHFNVDNYTEMISILSENKSFKQKYIY